MGSKDDEIVEIEEDMEGGHVDSEDYFFDRIGKPIPILNHQSESQYSLFDLQSPPSCTLAVSDFHRLIFLAYPLGFCVARTKDVMDAAVDIQAKGTSTSSSVQDLCIVDVPIGKVHILSLSTDSSTLAVSVAADVHFFTIDSLLNKELNPSFSCSLSESSAFVKDIQWRRRSETSCLVLSNHGKLYHAALASPLKQVMDNVDAVEWSLKGKYIAVARENILHILSSEFKERLLISLPFKSWIGDSNDNYSVKVDSIRWVRPDSIVVGCFQQTADGREENYLLQVIRSKDGKITDASSTPSVLSFYDSFYGLIDDIVPYGNGPYLFLSYIESCGLAITANRKNTDQHIQLLHWSVEDDMSETAIVDIDRDTWLPRIELQGNGDDNLITGLGVDKVSLYGKLKVEVGLEHRELSPFCVLLCVTLEGKLLMFYVASATGPTDQPEADSTLHDEEEDSFSDVPSGFGQSNLTSGLEEQTLEQVALGQLSKREQNISEVSEIPTKKDLMPSGKSENSMPLPITEQISHKDTISKGLEVESLVNSKPSVADDEEKILTKLHQAVDAKQVQIFGLQTPKLRQQSAEFGQSSLKNSALEGPSYFAKIAEFRSGPAFSETVHISNPSQPTNKDLQRSIDLPKDSPVSISSTGLQGAPSQSWSGGKVIFSGGSETIPAFLPGTIIQGNKSDNTGVVVDTGKPFQLKDTIIESPSTNFSLRQTQIMGQKATKRSETIDSLPSIRNSHLTSQETFALGRSANQRPYSSNDAHKAPSFSNSEPHISRQFGNIKEMAKELDMLLECIVEPGGFRDACIVSHRSSVEALEEGMQTLSGKCRMWKSMLDEQLGEIQNLIDKTVQVLARKIYLEGIVKQASDNHYWELWNRQKLSAELELKRRHILKLNQVLINQLIELERHFNTLELHKFSENDGVNTGRRVFQSRYGSSRQIQSLHGLHNTINSQLAAAKQLSECLSKQMAVLSIESPVKQRNVKKELFETIGIPYESSFSSPDVTKVGDSSSLKKHLLSLGSAANKYQSRRCQSSAMKSADSETARRRRDSLDQSWASFETSKTTVKRVLLQESQKASLSKSSLMDRQQLGPSVVDSSSVSYPKDLIAPTTFMYPSGNKGTQYMFPKQAFDKKSTQSKLVNDSLSPSQATGLRPPILQSNNAPSPSNSASQAWPMTVQVLAKESGYVTSDRLSGKVSSFGKSDSILIPEDKFVEQSETCLHKKSSVSMELPAQTPTLTKKSSEILGSNMKGTVYTSSTIENVNHVPTSTKVFDSSFSLLNTAAVPSHPGKVPQLNVATSISQPREKASFPPAFSMSLSVSSMPLSVSSPMTNSLLSTASSASNSSSTSSLSVTTAFGTSFISSKDNDASQTVPLISSSSVSSVFPTNSFSLQPTKSLSPLNTPPPVSQTYKTELQSATGKMPPSINPTHSPSISEVQLPTSYTSGSVSAATPPSTSESLKTEVQLPTSYTSGSVSATPPPSTSESCKPGPQLLAVKTSSSTDSTTPLTSDPHKTQLQSSTDKLSSRTDVDTGKTALQGHSQSESPAFSLKIEPPVSSGSTTEISPWLVSGSQSSLNNMASASSNIALNVQPKRPSDGQVIFGGPLASDSATSGKNANLDVTEEDEMEEEAPETSRTNEISLGSLGDFGLGSTPSLMAPRSNPFGGSFGNIGTTQPSSSFTMTVPSGELFRPASFSFSPQPSQTSPLENLGAFSGGFGTGAIAQAPAPSGFGQPAQIGAGQQALGSVLGSFGQSRQFGTGLPGHGGFTGISSMGGFSSAATGASTGGGFAGLASGGGGFAGVASGAGGFAGMASTGGGFGGLAPSVGGFAAAAPGSGGFAGAASGGGFAAAGGGFGAFNSQQGAGGFSAFSINTGSNQQGTAGFSAFSGNAGGTGKPKELFTQMRK